MNPKPSPSSNITRKKYDVDVVHHDLPGVVLRIKRGKDKFVSFELCTVAEKQSTFYAQMHGLHI